jgi:pimeloyl-ACP methyl ester carboxylesterase
MDDPATKDAALTDIDWSALPAGAAKGSFAAPSGTLATLSMGDEHNPWVVLVPGVTGSKEDFGLMLPLLASAGYYALSFDMAGQYESGEAGPASGHFTYDLFAADLAAVLESAPQPAHVVGYSFAGIVAQVTLSLRPELFASLTLLSTPPLSGQGLRGIKRLGRASRFMPAPVGAAIMYWAIRYNAAKVPHTRHEFVLRRLTLTNQYAVNDIIGLIKRTPDLRATLRDWPRPKLVAVGERDLFPSELQAALASDIGADFIVYPTGHSPCETMPHQLTADLVALYSRN